MYCQKLKNILDNPNEVNMDDIIKFDRFLREHCTIEERYNINAFKYAVVMNLDLSECMKVLIAAIKEKLMSLVVFYLCECGETVEIHSKVDIVNCECGESIVPQKVPARVYYYFKLEYRISTCEEFLVSDGISNYFDREFNILEPTHSNIENALPENVTLETLRNEGLK